MKNVLSGFQKVKSTAGKFTLSSIVYLYTHAALAANDVSLPSPSASFLQKITSWLQDVVDFIGGAGVLFIAFVSAAAGIALWVLAPKSGGAALGWVFRACVGAIGLFNIALIISWLQS